MCTRSNFECGTGYKSELRGTTQRWAVCLLCLTALPGCLSPWFRPKDAIEAKLEKRADIRETLLSDERPALVREIAVSRAPTVTRLENISIVSSLNGTGGKVNPSAPRDKLLDEMSRREVANPNQFLDDPTTAMVTAEAIVPPAAQKLDRLDIQVKLSQHAEGTDLQGGWLMETNLAEANLLAGRVREGFDSAVAQGQLVTRAQSTGSDKREDKCLALVVGGGVLLTDRPIGINIRSDFADAVSMAAIAPAINKRFTYFNGIKYLGVATPAKSNYVDLKVPTDYRLDPAHFINVVMCIGFLETPEQLASRLEKCRKTILDPVTARDSACQLEAIGKAGIGPLVEAISHANPEVRFYAAHSLAYLNDARAIGPLVELARSEPAFRAMAYNGLTVLKHFEAGEALAELLHSDDVEVRYGAVIALRRRDSSDSQIIGRTIANVGSLLEIPSKSAAAVAVSLTKTPEVVIFGDNPRVKLAAFEYVNPRLLLSATAGGRISISHFSPGKEDRVAEVDANMRSVLIGMAEVGGNYGDWVAFLSKCQRAKLTEATVAINPVPMAGRVYQRSEIVPASFETSTQNPAAAGTDGKSADPAIKQYDQLPEQQSSTTVWFNPWSWWK